MDQLLQRQAYRKSEGSIAVEATLAQHKIDLVAEVTETKPGAVACALALRQAVLPVRS